MRKAVTLRIIHIYLMFLQKFGHPHNYLNTSFTGATTAENPQVQEQDTEQDECCGSGCGCHD